jgi:hypothetical protein
MNIITTRPISRVNIDSGDDFYSLEGDYSNAKGDKKEKEPKDKTPKNKEPKKSKEEKQAIRDTRKTTRETNKEKRQKDKVDRRLPKAKTKIKAGATPLTEKVSKDGKGKAFFEKIKGLFKRKNPKTGKDEYVKTDKTGKEKIIDPKDVEVKNNVPFFKEDIKEAINDGATLINDASGLIAEYSPEEVIAVDDENSDSSEYYKKSDIEGNWWTKQSTTIKIAIVGGSLALVGFIGYMIYKSKK